SLATFEDSAVARPEIRSIMNRIRVIEDGPPASAPLGGSALVQVAFDDGRSTSSRRVDIPRGAPQNPLSWSQLAQKFRDCAKPILERSEEHTSELQSPCNLV